MWEVPIPIGPRELPPFPVERLGGLAPWVRAQVEAKNVAPAVSALSALAVISTAIGGRRRVEAKDDWIENACLYVIGLAPSSGRKTPALAAAKAPLMTAVGILKDAQADDVRLHNERVEIATARYERAKQKAVTAGKDAEADLDTARSDMVEAGQTRHLPLAVIGGDSTPEYVVKVAAEQGGRVAALGSESGFIKQTLGAYGTDAIMDFPLEAYTGSAYDSGRVSRGGLHMPHTAMTVGLIIQPDPIEGLSRRNPEIKGNGFVNRILFAFAEPMPPGTFRTPAVPHTVAAAFDARVAALVEHVWAAENVAVMHLTADATDTLEAFYNDVEQRRAPGGDLHNLAEWAGKLCGQVIRIAACLTLYSDHGTMEIEGATMADAIALGAYFTAHARRAMEVMDATTQGGHKPLFDILAWLKNNAKKGKAVSARDVWRGLNGRAWAHDADTVKAAMAELEELGWVAEIPADSTPGKRGRKPSPRFEMHPWVHDPPLAQPSPVRLADARQEKRTTATDTRIAECVTDGCRIRVNRELYPDGRCYDHGQQGAA